jgi:hypothetical protein
MIQKLKTFWSSLPHQVQAAIVVGVSASGETLAHVIEEGQIPHTWAAAEHLLSSAVVTGFLAAWAFYRLPNRPAAVAPADTPTGPNAPQVPAPPAPKP